jgi:hypothetical protein
MNLRTLFVSVAGALLAVTAASVAPASATTWNWEIIGAGSYDGSGTISGSVSCGVGCFEITAATGDIAGDTITGISTFANQFGAPDNYLFPSAADPFQIDTLGISFAVSGPFLGTAVNIFHEAGFDIDKLDPQNGTGEAFGDFMIVGVVATPLPAALPLFAGGLGMIGLLGRRKNRKLAATRAA